MTCKDCLNHEAENMPGGTFYCEAYNDVFTRDDIEGAESCNGFNPTENKGADER